MTEHIPPPGSPPGSQDTQDDDRWFENRAHLATHLGVSPGTLKRVLEDPGAPPKDPVRGYSLKAVEKYVREDLKIPERPQLPQSTGMDREELLLLRLRELKLNCEAKELKLNIEKGRYMLASKVMEVNTQLVTQTIASLRKSFESELPLELVGLSAPEIRVKLQASLDAAFKELHGRATDSNSFL